MVQKKKTAPESRPLGISFAALLQDAVSKRFADTLDPSLEPEPTSAHRVRRLEYGKAMNATLLKAILLLVPVSLLLSYSTVLLRRKTPWSTLQLLGSACLMIVVLAHICEALRLFPWMGWGAEHSAGHYLDLSSAVLGLTLFPTGYVLRAVRRHT